MLKQNNNSSVLPIPIAQNKKERSKNEFETDSSSFCSNYNRSQLSTWDSSSPLDQTEEICQSSQTFADEDVCKIFCLFIFFKHSTVLF